MYSHAERVFILEHYFALKSSSAVHEAFSKAYPNEAPNLTQQYKEQFIAPTRKILCRSGEA
jgi:hypothetical protein